MLKPIYQTTQSHIPQQYNINIQENTNKCTILYIKASFTIKELEFRHVLILLVGHHHTVYVNICTKHRL